MKLTISTTVDAISHKEAKDNGIAWNDALEFGIKFLLAEKQGFDYPENKLSERILKLTKVIEDQAKEIDPPKIDQEKAEKEAEEILTNIGTTE